jgi:hypothetical protein
VADYQARLNALLESKEEKGEPAPKPAGAGAPVLLPAVQGHISALYSELLRGDAAPTAAQLAATAASRESLAGLMADWHKLQGELPDLNRQLKAAGLAPVRPDLAPPRDVNVADEE